MAMTERERDPAFERKLCHRWNRSSAFRKQAYLCQQLPGWGAIIRSTLGSDTAAGCVQRVASIRSGGHGYRSRSKRYACANPCAGIGLGVDAESSVYLVDSLSHADQPQSSTVLCIRYIKSYALVSNLQFELPRTFLQPHLKAILTTVLHCIAQSFLNHAKERK